jgi:RTA1 like protein
MASTASHQHKSTAAGNDIMIAGLAFQVLTLLIFMCFCIDFAIRTRRRFNTMGDAGFNQSPAALALRGSLKFKGFLAALTLATICIFWRSVYRVAELGEGWDGDLIKRQWLFVGFEGVMVIVACLALNIFHPAFCFKEGVEGLGGVRALWQSKKNADMTGSGSGSGSDVETAKA